MNSDETSAFSLYNKGRMTGKPDRQITLSQYVAFIKSDKLGSIIGTIRSIEDKGERNAMKKASLPSCSVQCVMSDRSKGVTPDYIWTGYWQCDLDEVSTADGPALRDRLAEMAHCHCAHLSPSGKVKGVFLYELPAGGGSEAYHKTIAKALTAEVLAETGQQADRINDGKRICYLSADPDIKVNPFATPHPIVEHTDYEEEEEEDEWAWTKNNDEKITEAKVLLKRIYENGAACLSTFHEPDMRGKILPNVCAVCGDDLEKAIRMATGLWQFAATFGDYADLIEDKVERCMEANPTLSVGTLVEVLKAAELSVQATQVEEGLSEWYGVGAPEDLSECALYAAPNFFWPSRRGFYRIGKTDLKGVLKKQLAGRYGTDDEGKRMLAGHVNRNLDKAMSENHIDYVGEIAGRKRGIYERGHYMMLAKKGWEAGPAVKGDVSVTMTFIEELLGGKVPATVFLSWLQRCLQDLMNQNFRQKGVPILVGDSGIGKSTLQELISLVLNGEGADASPWIVEGNKFQDGLEHAVHLACDDPAQDSSVSPDKFEKILKTITTYKTHRIEKKGIGAIQLPVIWAASISLNNEPRHLKVLPMHGEGISNKLHLFLCQSTSNLGGNGEFPPVLMRELAALRYYLLHEHVIPVEWADVRFGVRSWSDPELMLEQKMRGEENSLVRMLMRSGMVISDSSAGEIYAACQKDPKLHARLSSPVQMGKSLGKIEADPALQEALGVSVRSRIKDGYRLWTVTGNGFSDPIEEWSDPV